MTVQYPRLAKAPIVEAVLAIEVEGLALAPLSQLHGAASEISGDYGAPEPLHLRKVQFDSASSGVSDEQVEHGFRVFRSDRLQLVQFTRDGFLFSRLEPYESWELFAAEAKRLWTIYRDALNPVLKTLGLRYVNKVFIPLSSPLETFLNVYPQLIPALSGPNRPLRQHYMRIESLVENPSGLIVCQQFMLPPERDGYATFVLDNDFRFVRDAFKEEEAWEIFAQARRLKDEVFFSSVTDRLLEDFR